jgi:hypothetical protein
MFLPQQKGIQDHYQGFDMRRVSVPAFFATSVLFAIGAMPAWADLGSAAAAYKKGEFASAFQQFKELAELGQPEAQ